MSTRDNGSAPARGTRWRTGWLAALAVAAVVVALVAGVQLVTGPGTDAPTGGSDVAGAPVPTAGGAVAAAVELFGDDAAPDVRRDSVVDLAAAWPVADCLAATGAAGEVDAGSTAAVTSGADAGRVDFVTGTEQGPEYARDVAIGWYVDAAAARTAYDRLLAALQTCAESTGARLVAEPDAVGDSASRVTTWRSAGTGAVEQSTYALATAGAVVVLASDHAATYVTGDAAPSAFEGTVPQAERLLAEACRVDPARC